MILTISGAGSESFNFLVEITENYCILTYGSTEKGSWGLAQEIRELEECLTSSLERQGCNERGEDLGGRSMEVCKAVLLLLYKISTVFNFH